MPSRPLSRRRWLQSSLALCGSSAVYGTVPARRLLAAAAAPPAQSGINRFPRMVHEAMIAEVQAILRERRARLTALKTKADAEAYVVGVQEKIQNCFGPWPEKTPLNPQVTGVVERDAYRIEKIIFESRPQFFVTANLYIPKGLKGKAPGVVGSCGHSSNGKAGGTYQSFAQGLARQGYVVLIFDPIGQGERLQLPTEADVRKSRVGIGVGEHMMVGNQQFLVGEFFGSWRAWDGIRALDYLLSREEVDPQHVGITGNSGGGTMSTWLCGIERRWTMGAPSCFVTSFLRNLENELPADTEQCPPGVLGLTLLPETNDLGIPNDFGGLDHGDFLIAMAPKPVIMMGQESDYFDVRGLTDTYHDVRRVYELLGAEKNVAMFIGANDHGYHQDAREAMYAHFNRATGRGDAPVTEPAITMEDDATLQCTKSGQVADELESRPVYSFTGDLANDLIRKREKKPEAAAAHLRNAVKELVDLRPRYGKSFDYRILRTRPTPDYPLPHTATYVLESEAARSRGTGRQRHGVQTVVNRLFEKPHLSRVPKVDVPAILYVAHDSSDVELRDEPLVREVLAEQPDAALYALDVRGLGESRPNTCSEKSYYAAYGCDYFYAAHAIMLGRSYVSDRSYDVFSALDFIRYHGGHPRIHVVARGYGAIPAALAALLHPNVARVTLKHALTSYADVAQAEVYGWPLSSLLPNVLKHFDLPDVYRELKATKQLTLIEPKGAEGPS